jgi:AcrR family transcriptional regulator
MATTGTRRGRPPKSAGRATRDRLLDAASSACADHGFDGATLQEIARRAGVTTTAVYNHFGSREDLLYAAGVRGLQRMTEAVEPMSGSPMLRDIALAYLRPDMAETRRLLAELHLASRRDARLADLLRDWHTGVAGDLVRGLPPSDDAPAATVKALFLVLLGLCHLEDLAAVDADPDAVSDRVARMVERLADPLAPAS